MATILAPFSKRAVPQKFNRNVRRIAFFLCLLSTFALGQGTNAGGTADAGGTAGTQNRALTISSLAVTPNPGGPTNVGENLGFRAILTLSNGIQVDITGSTGLVWTISNPSIARVVGTSATQDFQCTSAGTTQITATYNGISGSSPFTCVAVIPPTPTPTGLTISPLAPTIPQGQPGGVQYTATEAMSDGTSRNVTATAVWSSSNTAIVTKPTGGGLTSTQEFDCAGTGSATITVSIDGFSPTTTQTCSAVLSSIIVTPATPSVVAGNTFQFLATCNFTDGSSQPCASPTWTSTSTATATINTNGLATAVAAGSTTIRAALGAISGTTVMTVTAPGPPPATLSSLSVTPSARTVNVGQSLTVTATGLYSDGSSQNISASPTVWTTSDATKATLQLPDALVGSAYSTTLPGTGATPWQWTVPAATSTGQIDVLDWACMPLPDRNSFHMAGNAVKYCVINGGLLWWIKGSSGVPWDGLPYDGQWIYDGFTEDGDAADQAACGGSCYNFPTAFKRFLTPISAMPRYFTLGGPDVVMNHPSPNTFMRTTNCGADNQPNINLGNIVEVFHDGDYFAGTSTRAFGGSVGTVHTLERLHFWGLSTVNPPYQSGHVEVFDLALGYGQIEWRNYHWGGSSWVLDQDSLNPNKVAGGSPTPNFACKIPNITAPGNLPPGTTSSASPKLNLGDSTGTISGTPNTAGTYSFNVQQEDAGGVFHLQPQTIVVNATANTATQKVRCIAPGPVTITATNGIVTNNTTVTCQAPVPTLTSIAVTAANPTQYVGSQQQFQATGTYSDGSTSNLTTLATWTSSNTAVATIPATIATAPISATCASPGSTTIQASYSAVNGSTTLTCQPVPTNTSGNTYCTTGETWIGPTTDGPAALPTHCDYTAMSATPSPGSVVNVAAGDAAGFQTALNVATCGQTITLAAGSVYTGSFVFPAHSCDSAHWITVRTSALSLLPPEGTRVTPCYANVQLPSRPGPPVAPHSPGNCPALVSAMAKLKGSGTLDETMRFAAGANYYRLIGLEVEAKTVARTAQTQNIMNMLAGAGSHLFFDRMWWHGTPDRSTVRVALMGDGVSQVAAFDSSATDIHCLNGVCTDSQFFQGGLGNSAKSSFKGFNNYVEVSGTNSMSFGGGGATVMPSDFEWRNNYEYKPMIWNPACVAPLPVSCSLPDGTPVSYDGLGPYSVKNILEVKNIVRALIEGNIMENNWMHADQNASAILLTPKNQSGNQCPLCTLKDVTIRYNHIISSGGFAQIVNTSADDGGLATEGSHYSIHDNVAENLNYQGVTNTGFNFATYGIQTWTNVGIACGNSFVQHDVSIIHNTLIIASGRNYNAMHQLDGPLGACESNMVMRDNIAFYGGQGVNQVSNTACAGPTSTNFTAKYTACWTNPFVMTNNAIINGVGTWPTGNSLTTLSAVGFANYNNGRNGDYTLLSNSPFHNTATDGKDLGADIGTLNQKTAGVR